MKELGWGGLFPFSWKGKVEEDQSFDALRGGFFVAPILQTLILNRDPKLVIDYADKVAKWPMKRVITCHLGNNVPISGKDFRNAFKFLEAGHVQPNRKTIDKLMKKSIFDVFFIKSKVLPGE
mmetsp:Transcript_12974/g.19385  ORF Transcript_12974/g.19385 Transcript_12974/m.19385 type:complete len:122 (+) Transcript_12974:2-367(+)